MSIRAAVVTDVADGDLNRRVLRRRLESLATEQQRNGLPLFAANAIVAVLIGQQSMWWQAAAWLVVSELIQLLRRRDAAKLLQGSAADPAAGLRLMIRWTLAMGLVRAVSVALAFATGDAETWNLTAIIVMGLAAGSVATTGGEPRIMRAWAYPALGSVAVGWMAQMTWQGSMLSVLTLYLSRVLIGYVALLGEQGRQLVEYARDIEGERDRVREANKALADLTDDLRAERDRVAAADAAKTRVLASVSHDLRQPLFALSLNASALGDVSARLDDPYLKRIESGLRRGLVQSRSLLNQLVDFSRLEAGSIDLQVATVEIGPLLASLAPQYEAEANGQGLNWRLGLGDEAQHARTDPILFERLLGNLLQNAIKFTRQGEVGLQVLPATRPDAVVLEVFDTGPGIPLEEHARVFEEFYQLDNPSRDRSRGLGLGLSIVRRLAGLLDIQVELVSQLGLGCRFVLALPRAVPVDAGDSVPQTSAIGCSTESMGGVVLAIDDQADLLEDLSTMLTLRGWRVLTASTPDEACAVVLAGPTPDVVLTDYRLGDRVTGLSAIRAVERSLGRELPAVIVTGDTAPHRIAEANATGYPVLHKPLDGHVLDSTLREAASRQPGQE